MMMNLIIRSQRSLRISKKELRRDRLKKFMMRVNNTMKQTKRWRRKKQRQMTRNHYSFTIRIMRMKLIIMRVNRINLKISLKMKEIKMARMTLTASSRKSSL